MRRGHLVGGAVGAALLLQRHGALGGSQRGGPQRVLLAREEHEHRVPGKLEDVAAVADDHGQHLLEVGVDDASQRVGPVREGWHACAVLRRGSSGELLRELGEARDVRKQHGGCERMHLRSCEGRAVSRTLPQ